jgi:hypothetical protein
LSLNGRENIPERMRPLYRPRCRVEDNINLSHKEIWITGLDIFGSEQVSMVESREN